MTEEWLAKDAARSMQRKARAAKARKRAKAYAKSLEDVRVIVEYEHSPPRCANCVHFEVSDQYLKFKGYDVPLNGTCRQHGFSAVPTAICNTWEHPLGDRLEIAATAPASQQ